MSSGSKSIESGKAQAGAASVPDICSSVMATYEAGLKSGRFRIQLCHDCSRHVFYPRVLCPHCASANLDWIAPSGAGTVYSTTVVRRPDNKGGPYNVVLVDLAEGVRLMSRVDGIAPEEVRIGMPVRLSIAVVNGVPAPVFHPSEGRGV